MPSNGGLLFTRFAMPWRWTALACLLLQQQRKCQPTGLPASCRPAHLQAAQCRMQHAVLHFLPPAYVMRLAMLRPAGALAQQRPCHRPPGSRRGMEQARDGTGEGWNSGPALNDHSQSSRMLCAGDAQAHMPLHQTQCPSPATHLPAGEHGAPGRHQHPLKHHVQRACGCAHGPNGCLLCVYLWGRGGHRVLQGAACDKLCSGRPHSAHAHVYCVEGIASQRDLMHAVHWA